MHILRVWGYIGSYVRKEDFMSSLMSIFGYVDKGYNGYGTRVECSIRSGFPGFDITGLPGASVKEARERVRCAIRSCGFKFPQNRVLVNLSPASQPKDSTLLDLPLACAVLTSQAKKDLPGIASAGLKVMIAGELSLEGAVLRAPQTIGAVEAARRAGCGFCIVPESDSAISDAADIRVIEVKNLAQAFSVCCDIAVGNIESPEEGLRQRERKTIFGDVIGMEKEKDLVSLASCGFHSILLFGPPGVGKTMLSRKLHLLLPPLSEEGENEVSRIMGCADIHEKTEDPRVRMLGHDCTQIQFVSGKTPKSPGEGALSHLGTLILDELDKYPPKLLETVRDTYDKGFTQSSRSGEVITYPARYLMVANMNACACANLGDPDGICTCTAQKLTTHWAKVGRQMIERFDMRIPVGTHKDLLSMMDTPKRDDSWYLDRIHAAAERQKHRYRYIDDVDFNGQIHYDTASLGALRDEIALFNTISGHDSMNSRSQIASLALARTIADWDDCPVVTGEHFEKAAELRRYGLGDYYWRSLR